MDVSQSTDDSASDEELDLDVVVDSFLDGDKGKLGLVNLRIRSVVGEIELDGLGEVGGGEGEGEDRYLGKLRA